MTQKILLLFFCFFIQIAQAQNTSNNFLIRSTTGIGGSSEAIEIYSQQYVLQQSIGQASVIGTLFENNFNARQGFIQPGISIKIKDVVNPLNLEVIIYPNPFAESITISFSEKPKHDLLTVAIFDVLGRIVISKTYKASENIQLQLSDLPEDHYILNITAGNQHSIKKIIKTSP